MIPLLEELFPKFLRTSTFSVPYEKYYVVFSILGSQSDSSGGGDTDDDDGDPDIPKGDVLWFTPSVAWVEMLNGKILIWKLGRRLDKGM